MYAGKKSEVTHLQFKGSCDLDENSTQTTSNDSQNGKRKKDRRGVLCGEKKKARSKRTLNVLMRIHAVQKSANIRTF